jgi:NAD(P)H-hydrate repair Nnr-like enzyme with NAD(P)H-hydrate dehydratase domain
MQALTPFTHLGETTGPRRTTVLATHQKYVQAMCNSAVGDSAEKMYAAMRGAAKQLVDHREVMMTL